MNIQLNNIFVRLGIALTLVALAVFGSVLTTGIGRADGIELGPEDDPGTCANTAYTLVAGESPDEDARNQVGFVKIDPDTTQSCVVIETNNAEVVDVAVMSNTRIGLTTVDATHYRIFTDGMPFRGVLQLKLKQTVADQVFGIVVSGLQPSAAIAPASCPNNGAPTHLNHESFGLADVSLNFRPNEVGSWSSWEWVTGGITATQVVTVTSVVAGTQVQVGCVQLYTMNVTNLEARTFAGDELLVHDTGTNNANGQHIWIVYQSGEGLPESFLISVQNAANRRIKQVFVP